jgi:subfamily B ATP-binding cassette protein HlyB/CyaB
MNNLHLERNSFFWALQSLCALHRKPYSSELAEQQLSAPYQVQGFVQAAERLGLDGSARAMHIRAVQKAKAFPVAALCKCVTGIQEDTAVESNARVVLVLQADAHRAVIADCENSPPRTIPINEFKAMYAGFVIALTPAAVPGVDAEPDGGDAAAAHMQRRFGFRWFLPELKRHKRLWQEILLASLVIQLIALATPLFTQAIIDKVVVHRTESTLIVVVIGMAVFMLFSAILSWLRQYLVLHTGNRIDAALGAAVFERLFKLPPMYFQYRPTGVIAARLHGVETIREFISSAAVTLMLDLPFLLIFAAIMFYYSVALTLIVLAILTVIVASSLVVAPLFQMRLQEQFQLGARNQAFVTEYVVGLETVKSLQLESQLGSRYRGFLASYLTAGFATKQLANTYNTFANLAEQMMTLLVLGVGAYTVMHSTEFTIGMLVAFQMLPGACRSRCCVWSACGNSSSRPAWRWRAWATS